MHLQCPHCHSTIEVVEARLREIVCPSCGSSIQLDPGATTAWSPSDGPRRLGKFEFLEQVGLGSFGTVYKARDTELDRTVAIKIPRAGNVPKPEDVDRFLREAKSTAQLTHPGIVSLYDAGQSDGTCYLVSEFIQGATLAERLSAKPFSFRQAAELIAEVADALHYAHEHGVVHRDLKPSNIMLDLEGRPHLMDFGLAKRAADEITMTLEGQVLGTPAYMSPEQARGEVRKVNARSDIYSLGVILYELLTGELPFRGQTRMLLVQVIQDEPRPPRRLNDRIPRDLETICLKAMAKEPGRRYQTGRDFADDLRRFLQGEPIHARPVGRLERTVRWARRRPAAAALIGVCTGAMFAVLGLSLWHSARLNAAIEDIRDERDRADRNFQAARDEQERADRNFQKALDAVNQMLTEVAESDLAKAPYMEPVRRKLLERALAFFEDFAAQPHTDSKVRLETAHAYERVADVHRLLGQHTDAEAAYERGLVLVEGLLAESPRDPRCRYLRFNLRNTRGILLDDVGRYADAEKSFAAATDDIDGLVKESPDNPTYQANRASCLSNRAILFRKTGRYPAAKTLMEESLAIKQRLAAAMPEDGDRQWDLANGFHVLGVLQDHQGRPQDAEKSFRRGMEILQPWVGRFPDGIEGRRLLGKTYHSLGMVLEDRPEEADKAFEQALMYKKAVASDFPRLTEFQEDLANSHNGLGNVYRRRGDPAGAEAQFRAALAIQEKLVGSQPEAFDLHLMAAGSSCNLGHVLGDQGKFDDALTAYGRAVQTLKALHHKEPRHGTTRIFLRNTYQGRARVYLELRRYRESIADWDKAIEFDPNQHRDAYRCHRAFALAHAGDFAPALAEAEELMSTEKVFGKGVFDLACAYALAATAMEQGTYKPAQADATAERYAGRAVELLREAFRRGYRLVVRFQKDPALAPLRDRADFRKLLAELEQAAKDRER